MTGRGAGSGPAPVPAAHGLALSPGSRGWGGDGKASEHPRLRKGPERRPVQGCGPGELALELFWALKQELPPGLGGKSVPDGMWGQSTTGQVEAGGTGARGRGRGEEEVPWGTEAGPSRGGRDGPQRECVAQSRRRPPECRQRPALGQGPGWGWSCGVGSPVHVTWLGAGRRPPACRTPEEAGCRVPQRPCARPAPRGPLVGSQCS